MCLDCCSLLINSVVVGPSSCPLRPLRGRLFGIKAPSCLMERMIGWMAKGGRIESAGTAAEKHHLSAMLLIQRNYSAQLVKATSLSLWSSHQRSISERELWRGVVNVNAIHHQRKRPFREMKELRTNRGPDVTCLRLIEFLSTYAQENCTRRCYWGVFTPNTHRNGLLG